MKTLKKIGVLGVSYCAVYLIHTLVVCPFFLLNFNYLRSFLFISSISIFLNYLIILIYDLIKIERTIEEEEIQIKQNKTIKKIAKIAKERRYLLLVIITFMDPVITVLYCRGLMNNLRERKKSYFFTQVGFFIISVLISTFIKVSLFFGGIFFIRKLFF